jgi:hypothetical protein
VRNDPGRAVDDIAVPHQKARLSDQRPQLRPDELIEAHARDRNT